jgi:hypothetical protein
MYDKRWKKYLFFYMVMIGKVIKFVSKKKYLFLYLFYFYKSINEDKHI